MQSDHASTTILFTDIEGSTRLWEQKPQEMSRALKAHDALARAAVEGHGGVVVKMIGDGMYAAFADAVDGLRATLALQEALNDPAATEGVPLKVRCGLHLGAVEHRDNDYFGPPVNRSARIMGAAHGGQILLSQAVVDAIRARMPDGIELRDLGAVRLKDLASPERVYQVVHPELRQEFPALRSLEATPNNLPQQLTTFVGRERELAELGELLQGSRLLTLLGMGGLGKTRLSLQVAADALDRFPDGVWFVDLAPIRDASLVPSVVAQVLSVQQEPGRALLETLCNHLKSRTALIILDNCEHLVEACAALANTVLRVACDVRMIATSREALRVPGEQTYPVLPLPLPPRSASLEVLAKSDAVQLFVDRARSHRPTFELTAKEGPAVVELVSRLEGIPLALELAAARLRALSIADINSRLRDRFKLLTGGGRVLLERQQTLKALVGWSYDLLNAHEKVLFDRLCVFAGGWDLESAELVCGADPLMPEDVLDLLQSLVDKSLVMAEERDEGLRYRALETIREYAREMLKSRGESEAMAVRHCEHFLNIAKAGREGIKGAEQARWMTRLDAELDNLRVAMALALDGGVDPIVAVKFQVALMNFWILRGEVGEGRALVERALASSAVREHDTAHAHALYVGAALAASQSDYRAAEQMLQQCLTIRRGLGNVVDLAATLSTLSMMQLRRANAEDARASELEAISLFRDAKESIGEAIGLLHLGVIARYRGDDNEARQLLEQSLGVARRIRHAEVHCEAERMLGEIALERGDDSAARLMFDRALEVCRGVGDRRNEASTLWSLARLDLRSGDTARARVGLAAALTAFQEFEMHEDLLACLEDYARWAHISGMSEWAARVAGFIETQRERLQLHQDARSGTKWAALVTSLGEQLGRSKYEQAAESGGRAEVDDLVREALQLEEHSTRRAAA